HAKNCEGEWYNNKRRPAEADPIEVHPGKVTDGIDFTLPCERPRRGCIAGRVTNERTGRPIPRAFVAVFRRLEGQPVAHTFTDENGFYLVCRLEPGTYYAFAHAKDCDGEWYRNKRRREEADPIGVQGASRAA
ncbi:MAG: carboxypeptidase-like regulatory domain-containing protein, partial [bacterium]